MDNNNEKYPKTSSISHSASSKNKSRGQKSLDYSSEANTRTIFSETKLSNLNDSNNGGDNKRNGYKDLDRRQDKHNRESINLPLLGEGDDLNNNNISAQHSSYDSNTKSHSYQVNKNATATRSTHSDSNDSSNNNQDDDSMTRPERQLNNSGRNCVFHDSAGSSRRKFNASYEDGTDYSSHKEEDFSDDNQYDKNNGNEDMNNISDLNVTQADNGDNNEKPYIDLCLNDFSGNCKLTRHNEKPCSVRSRRRKKKHLGQEGDTKELQDYLDANISEQKTEYKSDSNRTNNFHDSTKSNNWKSKPRAALNYKSGSSEYFSQCSESLTTIENSVLFIKGYLFPSKSKFNMPASSNRYQTFAQSDEDLLQEPRSKFNESHRPDNPNRRYSKLNHHYITPIKKYTFKHEYASRI